MRPIPLYTGAWFYPDDPDPDRITIDVIAHGLSNLCRYTGQVRGFLSVAQHSVHVAKLIGRNGHPEWGMEALLHDAAEAFVCDLNAPVKEQLAEYQRIEDRILRVIWEKFDLDPSGACRDAVKQADRDSYGTEVRDFFPVMDLEHVWPFYGPVNPDGVRQSSWSPTYAKGMFLNAFEDEEESRVLREAGGDAATA